MTREIPRNNNTDNALFMAEARRLRRELAKAIDEFAGRVNRSGNWVLLQSTINRMHENTTIIMSDLDDDIRMEKESRKSIDFEG